MAVGLPIFEYLCSIIATVSMKEWKLKTKNLFRMVDSYLLDVIVNGDSILFFKDFS